MKTTKEKIEVMQAYERGEQIQFLNINNDWKDTESPTWNWCIYDYRVKPKPKYVQFETADEFLAALRKHGIFFVNVESKIYSLQDVFANHNFFDDGTPCRKEV